MSIQFLTIFLAKPPEIPQKCSGPIIFYLGQAIRLLFAGVAFMPWYSGYNKFVMQKNIFNGINTVTGQFVLDLLETDCLNGCFSIRVYGNVFVPYTTFMYFKGAVW